MFVFTLMIEVMPSLEPYMIAGLKIVFVRFHVGWRGERSIPYKGVETSPYETCFKTVRLTAICNGSKRTIFVSDGLGLYK